ncbi:Arm DNA-binding domain-containing protein [Castellaniella sp.]|uniref:Arm DNA-binding domain-containing protein n=1 Tax=Castellaniella sp. TaxID=1955812 RepID=UPI0035608BEA
MPKIAKQLSDLAARKARPRDVAYTLASGNGLFLVVLPTGGKQWRVRFQTPEGKRGNRVIGIYPDMGVADAHKATEALRQQVRMGDRPEGLYDHQRAAAASKDAEQIAAQQAVEEARRLSGLIFVGTRSGELFSQYEKKEAYPTQNR